MTAFISLLALSASLFFVDIVYALDNGFPNSSISANLEHKLTIKNKSRTPYDYLSSVPELKAPSEEFSRMPGNRSPEQTVDHLASKANEWNEPSRKSEEIYVLAIRQWLSTLPDEKRQLARKILREAHPVLESLRVAIREKKAQLAAISFDQNTKPETLPRMGQDLQKLRTSLRNELEKLGDRLEDEAGVSMGPLGGDGFWLMPPGEEAEGDGIGPRSQSCPFKFAVSLVSE